MSWKVTFQLKTEFAISNSVFAKLQQSVAEPAVRKRLEAQLHKFALGQRPAERSEVRTGNITVAQGLLLIENRLISVSPAPKDSTLISNTVELVSSDGYVRRHSFIWQTNLAFPGEAEMRNEAPKLLALPPALVRSEISNLLISSTNVTSEQVSAPGGSSRLRVRGQDSRVSCGAAWEMDLDLACGGFPRRIAMLECNGAVSTLTIEPGLHSRLGWVPVQAHLSVIAASGMELYRERWEFSDYAINQALPPGLAHVPIPVDYVVNDYRFSNAFAYVMGNRPPTREELEDMSRNKNAVLKYQRDTRLGGRALLFRTRIFVLLLLAMLMLPSVAFVKAKWFRRTCG
jgi:hypothetical protein